MKVDNLLEIRQYWTWPNLISYPLSVPLIHCPFHPATFAIRQEIEGVRVERRNTSDVYWTVHHCDNWRIKNQLDATYYFIVLLSLNMFRALLCPSSGARTMILITTLIVSFLVCWFKHDFCLSLQPGHHSNLTAPNLHHTANQERYDQCGNQHHSLELLMMGIVMPETCWAYKKYNKITSGF